MFIQLMVLTSYSTLFAAGIVQMETPRSDSKYVNGAKPVHRSLAAIRSDVSAALRIEATTRRAGDNAPQVLRLINLYREMAAHPQRDTSDVLNEIGQQVRTRLETVRDRIERRLSKSKHAVKEKDQKRPATLGAPKERVLAQQLPQQGGRAAGAGQGVMVTGIPSAAGLPADLGQELVELIQATISPETWNVNGGRGAIVYYSPLRVLVVSAPDEVHAQIGGVLGQLNAAQRQRDGAQVLAEVVGVQAGNQQQP